jgi:hypothetical protein
VEKKMLRMIFDLTNKYFVLLIFFALASNHGMAQIGAALPPPPVHTSIDSHGIDMIAGRPSLPGMYVAIGSKESGIERDPGRDWAERDNFTGTLTQTTVYRDINIYKLPIGTYIRVDTNNNSELFQVTGSVYVNYENTGGSLECNTNICTHLAKDGTVTLFDTTKRNGFSQSRMGR